MSDFTKEDLQTLVYCLSPGTYDSWPWPEEHQALQLKIKSMIESYYERQIVNAIQSDNDTLVSLGIFHSSD